MNNKEYIDTLLVVGKIKGISEKVYDGISKSEVSIKDFVMTFDKYIDTDDIMNLVYIRGYILWQNLIAKILEKDLEITEYKKV